MNSEAKLHRLSKTRYTQGLHCSKALYFEVHRRELKAPLTEEKLRTFDTGHQVGRLACEQYPGGVLIAEGRDQMEAALKSTQKALNENCPAIFEATFQFERVLVRVDILQNTGKGGWNILEVKSSGSVKKQHIADMAIQRWVVEQSGLTVGKSILKHVNSKCVWPDISSFFTDADCTDEVMKEVLTVPASLENLLKMLDSQVEPAVELHVGCHKPYPCDYLDHCWKKIPEYSVFELGNVRGVDKFALYREGITKISDIPDGRIVKRSKKAQIEAVKKNKVVVDDVGLRDFLGRFRFPLYFLDFESLSSTIPRYLGTRPFEQIPFQFSLHIVESPNAEPKHLEWLADSPDDPRKALTEALLQSIGSTGTLVSYNASFEKTRLNELAKTLNENRLLPLIPRFLDLQDCFTKYYTDPKFHGSTSIKSVLPILVPEMSYEGMEVSGGVKAQIAFERMVFGELSPEERADTRTALLAYCKQDTHAMVLLWKKLSSQFP